LSDLSDEFISNDRKNKEKSYNLNYVCGVFEVENAQSHCEYFPGGDDKGNNVLFEMFDHVVDEHLSHHWEYTKRDHVNSEKEVGW